VDAVHTLTQRNAEFATHRFTLGLPMMPSLRKLTQAAGGDFDRGFNIILLQHTDCGILRMQNQAEQLADFFGIDTESLEAKTVGDPRAAVEIDVAVLKADPRMPAGLRATGLVYDVDTGEVDTVIAPEGVMLSG